VLAEIVVEARREAGLRPRAGMSFEAVAEEWMRWGEHERAWKPTTLQDHRSALRCHLLPAFAGRDVATIATRDIEVWRAAALAADMTARNANKQVALTAAFTELRRGALVALRWRSVDFARELIRVEASYAKGALTVPKSGHGRVVPMVPAVAQALAALGQREHATGDDDLVFPGDVGGYLDASAMRRRYVGAQRRARLKALRFHDLRHTFGSLAINRASLVQLQHWLGHADMKTTARYLHHKSRADEARQVASAFATEAPHPANMIAG
jgi:integrase